MDVGESIRPSEIESGNALGFKKPKAEEIVVEAEKPEVPIKKIPEETLKQLESEGFKTITITDEELTPDEIDALGLNLFTQDELNVVISQMPRNVQFAIPPAVKINGSNDLDYAQSDEFMSKYREGLLAKYPGIEVSQGTAAEIALINKVSKGKNGQGKGIFDGHILRTKTLVDTPKEILASKSPFENDSTPLLERTPPSKNVVYYTGDRSVPSFDFIDKIHPHLADPNIYLTALITAA